MKALAHIATVAVILGVFLCVPVLGNVDVAALASGQPDAVSGATQIQDAPSGSYTVLINRGKRKDAKVLEEWKRFFSGGEVGVIMEDISCTALAGDAAGIEMAESLRSRLPENQMKLHVEDGTLALSKAQVGKFDAIVMSDEAAAAYDAQTLFDNEDVEVVRR